MRTAKQRPANGAHHSVTVREPSVTRLYLPGPGSAALTCVKPHAAALATLAGPLTPRHGAARPAMSRLPLPTFASSHPTRDADLLDSARRLRRAAQDGLVHRPLQGRNLGLIGQREDAPEASLFSAAARELGARVVWLPDAPDGDNAAATDTARLMGRLYDAIECQGLAPARVAWLREHTGVPVFDGLAGDAHPSAALADGLEGGAQDPLNRRCMLQAVLLGAMGST
jgi:ornithine carbamoyltransferase